MKTHRRIPNHNEAQWLRRIAQGTMMLTHIPSEPPHYSVQGGATIPIKMALTLINNGWVKAERDGLFDEPQTWRALKP